MTEKILSCDTGAPAHVAKRYTREMIVASLLYAAIIIGCVLLRRQHPPQWLAIALALLASVPVWMMLAAYLRYLRDLDEFQRRVQTESMLVAAAFVTFGSMTYGLLQSFAGFPVIEDALFWVFPAMCFVWSAAQFFVRRHYQ